MTVGPFLPAMTVHGHNDEQCWAFSLLAIAAASLSVLPLCFIHTHVFLESFLTSLSSPPSSFSFSSSSSYLVGSDCPAFLAFQLRMLEIPSSCCGLTEKNSPSFPSLHPSPLARLHLVHTRQRDGQRDVALAVWIIFTSLLRLFPPSSLAAPAQGSRPELNWRSVPRP